MIIRKAKKLKYLMKLKDQEVKNTSLLARVQAEFSKVKDQATARVHYERLQSILLPKLVHKKSDIPAYYFCPLTTQLLVDPVINEYGNTYEKKAYVSYTAANKKDPLTGKELDKNIMYDNIAVRAAIDHYLEE